MKETLVGRERLAAARKYEDDFLARAVEQGDVAVKRRRQEGVTSAVPATILDRVGGSGGASITTSVDLAMQPLASST